MKRQKRGSGQTTNKMSIGAIATQTRRMGCECGVCDKRKGGTAAPERDCPRPSLSPTHGQAGMLDTTRGNETGATNTRRHSMQRWDESKRGDNEVFLIIRDGHTLPWRVPCCGLFSFVRPFLFLFCLHLDLPLHLHPSPLTTATSTLTTLARPQTDRRTSISRQSETWPDTQTREGQCHLSSNLARATTLEYSGTLPLDTCCNVVF
jgi:hypothetical protein